MTDAATSADVPGDSESANSGHALGPTSDSSSIPSEVVPISCLTPLTDTDKAAYQTAIATHTENDYVQPDFIPWSETRGGTMQDMYRIWRSVGGEEDSFHFAFNAASEWARANLTAYLERKPSPAGVTSQTVPRGTYEGFLESLDDDILGKRGLTYGRVPASAFRSIWCNLETANEDLSEDLSGLVEFNGGVVQTVENQDWDTDAFMEKLERVIEEFKASGGEIE